MWWLSFSRDLYCDSLLIRDCGKIHSVLQQSLVIEDCFSGQLDIYSVLHLKSHSHVQYVKQMSAGGNEYTGWFI